MLKKNDWHERGPVTDQSHDRSGQPDKRSDKKLGRRSSQRRSSDARQLGCVFQDMTPPKSILRKCTDMRKPIQHVKFTKAIARQTTIRDQNPSLGYTGCCIELVLFFSNRYFWRKNVIVRVKRLSLEEFYKKCHDVVMWAFFLLSS